MSHASIETRLTALEQEVARLRNLLEQNRIASRIRRGLTQANRGQTQPVRHALATLAKKYNFPAP